MLLVVSLVEPLFKPPEASSSLGMTEDEGLQERMRSETRKKQHQVNCDLISRNPIQNE